MSELPKCSQCGAPLAADVPGQLCLRCLLEFGLKDDKAGPAAGDTTLPAAGEAGQFAGYQIVEKIGEGGCGVVYRAWQTKPLRREVAIKVIKLGMDTRSVIARFEAERQALALMDHPNIARVFDAGVTANGRPFFVMELVGGERITQYCDRKQLPVPQRLKLFQQVCQAVQHAHQKGVIHRDLKPSNILVVELDNQPEPKVIDFGIAKAVGQQRLADQTIYTAFDQFVGTPAYMSPEQAGLTGEDIDTRSDIYSLGVLLYELLTSRPPFEPDRLRRAALGEICRIIREEEPPLPSARLTTLSQAELDETAQQRTRSGPKLASELRGDLDWLVMKALEKDRARRYDSATALAADIERHLRDEPVTARPPSAVYRFRKMARRNKLAFGSAVVVVAALLAGVTTSTWMFYREKQARERAELRAYESDMGLAARMAASRVGGLEGAVKLLELWRSHQPDLRGWEWYYLNGLCHHETLTVRADSNQLWSATYSPDGKRLATGGTDGAVKIWDVGTGRALSILPGHSDSVLSVAWAPNGRLLASAGQDATVRIWDLESRTNMTLAGHLKPVDALAWRPDAKQLASGSLDGTVKIWNAASGAIEQTIKTGHPVTCLSWTQNGASLAGCGLGGLLKSWDAASGRELWSMPANSELTAQTVAWSPDGAQLATGGMDNSVSFLAAATGANLVSFFDNFSPVLSVAWNPAGTRLASATSGDGRIAIRDMQRGGAVIRDFRGHQGSVRCVCWRPDGAQLASASVDGTFKLWDVDKADPSTIKFSQPDQVPALAWSPAGARLAAGSRRTAAWIWDVNRLSAPVLLRGGFTAWTFAVAWNSSGTRLAAGGSGGLEIWDSSGPTELWTEHELSGVIHALAWSPDSTEVAAIGSGKKMRVWNAATGKLLRTLELPEGMSVTLAWSPDGRTLAGSVGSKIYFWDALSLAETKMLTGHTDGIQQLAWSPDGSRLASASDDTSAIIWDAVTGREISTLSGHTAAVYSVAWSPDGKRVVTGSWDLSAKIWDPTTGSEICSFDRPGGLVQMLCAVAWSPDGQRIACSDIEGKICILDATPGGPAKTASQVPQPRIAASPPETAVIRSLKLYCEAVEPRATNNADALRRLAWIRATSRYPELRDGPKAVAYAKEASSLLGDKNAGILSILAAAYAQTGDFTAATNAQRQALALSPNPDSRAEMSAELRNYERRLPYRDDSW